MNRIDILATGPKFIGRGIRGTEPVVEEILRQARSEIHIAAYVFTSSAMHLIDLIEQAAERGVKVTMVINNLEDHYENVRTRLKSVKSRFEFVRLVDFMDVEGGQLHAKVVVVDRKKAVIGSANFTKGGMVANYEIGAFVEGDKAWALAELIDILAG